MPCSKLSWLSDCVQEFVTSESYAKELERTVLEKELNSSMGQISFNNFKSSFESIFLPEFYQKTCIDKKSLFHGYGILEMYDNPIVLDLWLLWLRVEFSKHQTFTNLRSHLWLLA